MLSDQDSHELRGMLVHYLRLTPAAAAAKVEALAAKDESKTLALLEGIRRAEGVNRGSIQQTVDALLTPDS